MAAAVITALHGDWTDHNVSNQCSAPLKTVVFSFQYVCKFKRVNV